MKHKLAALLIPLLIIGIQVESVSGQSLKSDDWKVKFEKLVIQLDDPDYTSTNKSGDDPFLKVFIFKSGNWEDDTDWENKNLINVQAEYFPENIPNLEDFMSVYNRDIFKESRFDVETEIINGKTFSVAKSASKRLYKRNYAYFDGPIGYTIAIYLSQNQTDEKETPLEDIFTDLINKLIFQYQ